MFFTVRAVAYQSDVRLGAAAAGTTVLLGPEQPQSAAPAG